jgi:hypothetical protein
VNGGEPTTDLGALTVLGLFVVLVALCSAGYWLAYRAGWLVDPEPDPWAEWDRTPGGRTDRQRLLDEGRFQ